MLLLNPVGFLGQEMSFATPDRSDHRSDKLHANQWCSLWSVVPTKEDSALAADKKNRCGPFDAVAREENRSPRFGNCCFDWQSVYNPRVEVFGEKNRRLVADLKLHRDDGGYTLLNNRRADTAEGIICSPLGPIGTGRKQLPDFTLTGEQPDSSTWGETRRTQFSWSS